ncbi:hypothetical protein [Halobacteriovorax sp.]|uniref:hypothetical protein n=1 Tax=Halobacteriovorax sp. TaxID=2020862 RepID=UPI00356490CB
MSHKIKAQSFLEVSHQFKLGELATEKQHPKTIGLSDLSKNSLELALSAVKEIELDLIDTALFKQKEINQFSLDVQEVLSEGGRVFLCGCGATGRLSLALETIWNKSGAHKGRVLSFMAGGDVALIHSIENFEDHPDYGERQLSDLGFCESDLLIAITEGGETPFVIGAVEAASKVSSKPPYFLYCNTDSILSSAVERSKKVLENPGIKKLNLSTGEMVLTGSTRMQASTILMLVTGQAIFGLNQEWVLKLKHKLESIDLNILKKFIVSESDIYKSNGGVVYLTDAALGISVLTDTTERSPTFSLIPFEENDKDTPDVYSLCYLSLVGEEGAKKAWSALLGRKPRSLEWEDTRALTALDRLYRFDISSTSFSKRSSYCSGEQFKFNISLEDNRLKLSLMEHAEVIDFEEYDLLSIHLILKILLNTHSTLVMGRLGRYESNIMTWVRPSNNKLIDRTIRYILILLKEKGVEKSYEEVCYKLFEEMENAKKDDPLVLKTLESILGSIS